MFNLDLPFELLLLTIDYLYNLQIIVVTYD